MNCRLPILLLPLALVAACNDSAENDRRTASGKVLEGTISDDMLPVDTVQSQPPLMKAQGKKSAEGASEAASAQGAEPAGEASEEAPADAPAAAD